VLTPVSPGNSSALTHRFRVLMRDLPENNRKLLVFATAGRTHPTEGPLYYGQ